MEKETLLLEKKVEETKEKEVIEISPKREIKRESINLFSIKQQVAEVVEKPNFDKIQELPPEKRNKIFKLKKEKEETTPKRKTNSKLKIVLLGILISLFGAFFISNTVNIIKTSQAIQDTQSSYSASLFDLMQKISSTESGNRVLDLFETYPDQNLPANTIYKSSNWYDRLCDFLAGLFGG